MQSSRLRPELRWKALGAAVAHKGGDRAALANVLTGRRPADRWIEEGFESCARRLALRAARAEGAVVAARAHS